MVSYLASRHRGLAKQMMSETKSSQAVLVAPPPLLPLLDKTNPLVSLEETSTSKINPEEPVVDTPSMVPDALVTPSQTYHSQCLHLVRQHIIDPQPRHRSWIHQLLLLNAESFEKGGRLWWQDYVVTRSGCLTSYADSKRQLKVLKYLHFYLVNSRC